jgi:hypothetical protein
VPGETRWRLRRLDRSIPAHRFRRARLPAGRRVDPGWSALDSRRPTERARSSHSVRSGGRPGRPSPGFVRAPRPGGARVACPAKRAGACVASIVRSRHTAFGGPASRRAGAWTPVGPRSIPGARRSGRAPAIRSGRADGREGRPLGSSVRPVREGHASRARRNALAPASPRSFDPGTPLSEGPPPGGPGCGPRLVRARFRAPDGAGALQTFGPVGRTAGKAVPRVRPCAPSGRGTRRVPGETRWRLRRLDRSIPVHPLRRARLPAGRRVDPGWSALDSGRPTERARSSHSVRSGGRPGRPSPGFVRAPRPGGARVACPAKRAGACVASIVRSRHTAFGGQASRRAGVWTPVGPRSIPGARRSGRAPAIRSGRADGAQRTVTAGGSRPTTPAPSIVPRSPTPRRTCRRGARSRRR